MASMGSSCRQRRNISPKGDSGHLRSSPTLKGAENSLDPNIWAAVKCLRLSEVGFLTIYLHIWIHWRLLWKDNDVSPLRASFASCLTELFIDLIVYYSMNILLFLQCSCSVTGPNWQTGNCCPRGQKSGVPTHPHGPGWVLIVDIFIVVVIWSQHNSSGWNCSVQL